MKKLERHLPTFTIVVISEITPRSFTFHMVYFIVSSYFEGILDSHWSNIVTMSVLFAIDIASIPQQSTDSNYINHPYLNLDHLKYSHQKIADHMESY